MKANKVSNAAKQKTLLMCACVFNMNLSSLLLIITKLTLASGDTLFAGGLKPNREPLSSSSSASNRRETL